MPENNFQRLVFLLTRGILPFLLILVLILAAGPKSVSSSNSNNAQKPSMAPLNEEFIKYLTGRLEVRGFSQEGYPLGLLPEPHDLSSFNLYARPVTRVAALPEVFDLRSQNKLTNVRNQGSCGSCWAFAAYGSLESFLLPGELWDFSEQNLIDNHGFDYSPCSGGNIYMAAAYLSRKSGPIREEDDPYIYATGDFSPVKQVHEIIFIPPRIEATDNDLIKQAVMDYGAIYTTMYWDSSCYNNAWYSYYNVDSQVGPHAVAIVGWDDNFPASRFNTPPPGNGAFIVRNSWGSIWGQAGYFYVSYYDNFLGRKNFSAAVKATNPTLYDEVYQYDHLGWVSTWGYNQETAWMANIFQATSDRFLKAVSFYTPSLTSQYEIYIYLNAMPGQPRSGQLAASKNGTLSSPGYFTITLDSPVALTEGQYFSVVVKLTTPGNNYQICAEGVISGYSSQAVSNPGLSFISNNGLDWIDFGETYGWDVCLKAQVGTEPIFPPLNLTITTIQNNLIFFRENINRLTWEANPQNQIQITAYKIYRKRKNDSYFSEIATIGSNRLSYDDRNLFSPENYSYQVTAIDELGRESDPATVSRTQQLFKPNSDKISRLKDLIKSSINHK